MEESQSIELIDAITLSCVECGQSFSICRSAVQSRVQKTCEKKRIAVTRRNILVQIRDLKVAEFARQGATKKLNY
jgi:predicted DNA-binding protein (UPF0251 family)